MTLVGLTGNIGAGKSNVAAILRELGADVIDADRVYRELIAPGQPGWRRVVDLFGDEILGPDGQIDRKRLGQIVFRDSAALTRLEAATHPLVRARARSIIDASTSPVVVYEAIKLFESGAAADCDEVWAVTASPETRLRRLIASRGLTADEAQMRIAAQPDLASRTASAQIVISNDGDLASLRERVTREWRRLVAAP
ncbi:MAG: dephospho-CoA kinase [Chloroflexota bacterium]|nr:MAG: dephospho-CoA kinase [Chloroflexota bacterium]